MSRQYKMDVPVNTVNRIRKSFADLGILTYEQYWKDLNGKYYSCGVTIENSVSLKTLGKGASRDYCLASAYGELMERVENLILFTGNIGFPYTDILIEWPDVVQVKSRQELLELNSIDVRESVVRVCDELYLDSMEEFPNTVLAGKFYSVKDKKVVYLPYSEIYRGVRSNGMCAGNTPEEALIEGLCELMERKAIKEIFMNDMVPPIVPREHLQKYSSFAMIQELEQKGVSVEIRDCSMGKGLPVLGLLILNKKTGKYKYNFGSHPDFDRAIQRCLGEICQVSGGVNSIDDFISGGMQLSVSQNLNLSLDKQGKYFNLMSRFYKALKNSNGELPQAFFTEKPSYKFNEWIKFENSESYTEDIKIICKLLEADQQQIFVRDVSFLNFPAYDIYITDYSCVQVDQNFLELKTYLKNRRTSKNEVKMLARLNKCSEEEKLDLCDFIQLQINSPKFFNQEADNNWMREVLGATVINENIMCPQYVLALIELSMKNYKDAYKNFMYAYEKNYLTNEIEGYYDIFKVYLEMCVEDIDEEGIDELLYHYYDHDVVEKVLGDIKMGKYLKKVNILAYVNQTELNVISGIYKKMVPKIRESKIQMDDLRTYFS